MKDQVHKRVIISGGGTGGHIFPAIAIANALRRTDPGIEILFVGAEGRMEMERVPAAGYAIKGLPVAGFIRKISLKNILVLTRLLKSISAARHIIDEFKPDVVVGVGGYASGPVLRVAGRRGIPMLIQEQNSYAGITNKIISGKASVICVAYEGMERFFPAEKIILTGNPVRKDIAELPGKRAEGLSFYGLSTDRPVLLVLGGSLGSATLNKSILNGYDRLKEAGIQIIWQTGITYYESVINSRGDSTSGVCIVDFIERMDLVFAAADIIVSRAGAGTISELCIVAKPVILVPSPNVAEDHQTKNARTLADKSAATLIADSAAPDLLVDEIISLTADTKRREEFSQNISKLAIYNSDDLIASEVIRLIK
jgi:UDP-N-acetylglucosamine--N-acetylmuramyl-(pentapeptide) pyrophosphoryl-undecaprenol N-acetylglucosamine transferase